MQGFIGRLHHVGCGPVHVGCSEVVLTAVWQTHSFLGEFEGVVPIEICPEAIFARCDGLKQVIIFHIVGLIGNMQFEGEYLCSFIFDTARRFVDVGNAILAELDRR